MRLVLPLLAVALASCLPAPARISQTRKPTSSNPPAASTTVEAKGGTAEGYGPLPQREHRWTIHWNSASLTASGDKISTGRMSDVSGSIYRDGVRSLDFSADSGIGDQTNRVLRLSGNVRVTSVKEGESLLADAVSYDAATGLIRAKGNVRFKGRVGTTGTFSELVATSDFKRVGTPDLFFHP